MNTNMKDSANSEPMHVLLVGNNPIELSAVLKKLQDVRGFKIVTEIAFDVKSIMERLIRFNPNFILIDDNIGKAELKETIATLSGNAKTKDIPITLLKNSNYHESLMANSILDYLLKQNLSTDAIYNTLKNSFRFKKTQLYLYQVYQKRKDFILKLSHG
jgi:DNA-binding NarL/FixJ family response regulator